MDKCKTGLGYNVVPPPYTRNFMPPKLDLIYPSLDNFVDVNKSVSESKVEKPIVESIKHKTFRTENGAPIIEDWVSESKEEDEPKVQTVMTNFTKIKFVKPKTNRKPIEQFRQDTYRSLRGNKRNWNQQMSQKLGNDFEMFNKACHEINPILQIMKKLMEDLLPLKVILKESLNFKLTDESHVLLKVSRKDNMYSVDLKNVIPQGGKFDEKAGEGFFVGYSTNSKAFRVFNSRTRIVEENLHVKFSENIPNILGSGPNWLFDIDALTKFMNYKLVVAGNQSNGSSGTKACDNVGDEEKNDVKDPRNKDSEIPSTKEPRVNQEEKDNVNNTNRVNAGSATVNIVNNEVNDVGRKSSIEYLMI
nr:ribonuclease H-like domain-containing protein [Tanacetum cinerariifolium]